MDDVKEVRFKKGDIICRQGETVDALYTIMEGEVNVLVCNEAGDGIATDEMIKSGIPIAALSGTGSIIGEMGIFLEKRSASVVAGTDCILAAIIFREEGVKEGLLKRPSIGLAMARTMAKRLKEADQDIKELDTHIKDINHIVEQYSLRYYHICDEIEKTFPDNEIIKGLITKRHDSFSYNIGKRASIEKEDTDTLFLRIVKGGAGYIRKFRVGDVICSEGEPGNELYLILKGKVSAHLGDKKVDTFYPGEIVGETAILLGEQSGRTARLEAEEISNLAVIPRKRFGTLIKEYPPLIFEISKGLAKRVQNTNFLLCNRHKHIDEIISSLKGSENSCYSDYSSLSKELEKVDSAETLEMQKRLKEELDNIENDLEKVSGK